MEATAEETAEVVATAARKAAAAVTRPRVARSIVGSAKKGGGRGG